jgi:hypothetical protein
MAALSVTIARSDLADRPEAKRNVDNAAWV